MVSNFQLVSLSEVLDQYTEYICSPEAKLYPKLSVKLYGKGVVLDGYVNGAELRMKRHQIAKNGQVILSEIWGKKGAIGIVPPEGDGALCTSHFFLFDIRSDRILPKYLEAIFESNYLQPQLEKSAKGTTGYAAVRPKHLLSACIPLPSLEKQKQIRKRLDSVKDEVKRVQQLSSENKGYIQRLRQAFLQEAVSGKLVPQDPNDEPALTLLRKIRTENEILTQGNRIKKARPLTPITEEEIPYDLPKGWEWVRLGEIVKISSGDGLTSYQMNSNGRIPVFGGNGINGHHDTYNVNQPTIVIGRVGFYCGSIHLTPEKAWVTDNAFITYFSHEYINMDFLMWLLKGTNLKENESATAQPVISGRKIYPIVIGLPPFIEQKRIAEKIDQLMKLCDELEGKIKENHANSELLMEAVLKETFVS